MRKFNLIPALLLGLAMLSATACATQPNAPDNQTQQMAESFVRQEATYKFDGIPETLKLTGVVRIEDSWEFTFEYDSRHAGYGDRTGLQLAQVITPHKAVVQVSGGQVSHATMDGRWDMIQQRELGSMPPQPPAGAPAAPNNSQVTGAIIEVKNIAGDLPWELTIDVKTSEDLPGLVNATKSRIGQQIAVRTAQDMSQARPGQSFSGFVRLVGDERSHYFEASNISIQN